MTWLEFCHCPLCQKAKGTLVMLVVRREALCDSVNQSGLLCNAIQVQTLTLTLTLSQ